MDFSGTVFLATEREFRCGKCFPGLSLQCLCSQARRAALRLARVRLTRFACVTSTPRRILRPAPRGSRPRLEVYVLIESSQPTKLTGPKFCDSEGEAVAASDSDHPARS